MASFAEFDDSSWPIPVVRFVGLPQSEEQFAEFLQKVAFFERRQRYALIMDASQSLGATPRQRKMQAEWLGRYEDAILEAV